MENQFFRKQMGKLKAKYKRKAGKLAIRILAACAPFFLVLFIVSMIVAGTLQAFTVFGSFADALFGSSDTRTMAQHAEEINGLAIDEIIRFVETDQLDRSFYKYLMFTKDEFLHLLKSVKEENEQQVSRTIQIQARHTYQKWVEDDVYAANPEAGGHYETTTEMVYRDVLVNSAEIEKYQIDWQIVYAMCVADISNESYEWFAVETDEGEQIKHFGPNYERIDEAIQAVSMKYDYLYDLARSEQSTYTMEECQKMVHTPFLYGDPDTEEGEWEYYVPHSVLRSASSGYSTMYYTIDAPSSEGQEEEPVRLTHLIEASYMPLYDLNMRRFTYNYVFGYTCDLISLVPGGGAIARNLENYRAYENEAGLNADGTSKPGVILRETELADYILGDGISVDDIPVSSKLVNTGQGQIDYDGVEFDEGLGGIITMAALEKVGCEYDQNHRWEEGVYDCSSFVWRVLGEVGIDLSSYCRGSTAAEICRGMVDSGKMIDPADIRQGDIVFYAYKSNGKYNNRYRNISHVAIYAGDGKKVHAKGAAYGVVYDRFSTSSMVCVCRPY